MRVQRALEALEKGCCLELYYDEGSHLVEVHAVGFDADDRPVVQAWDSGSADRWSLCHLDRTRKVAVSGYFSEAPRPGFEVDSRLVRVLKAAD